MLLQYFFPTNTNLSHSFFFGIIFEFEKMSNIRPKPTTAFLENEAYCRYPISRTFTVRRSWVSERTLQTFLNLENYVVGIQYFEVQHITTKKEGGKVSKFNTTYEYHTIFLFLVQHSIVQKKYHKFVQNPGPPVVKNVVYCAWDIVKHNVLLRLSSVLMYTTIDAFPLVGVCYHSERHHDIPGMTSYCPRF